MGLNESVKALSALASPREKLSLLAAGILTALAFILDMQDYKLYENCKHWIICIVGVCVFWGVLPCTVRSASNAKHVWIVCSASVFLLAVGLCTFALAYFWASRREILPLGAERLLTVPAVGTALWGTAMGWYVHFQASSKSHRTANAFNLVMQTRTCAEFLKRADTVTAHYPFGTVVPVADCPLFAPGALGEAQRKLAEAKSLKHGVDEARQQLRKAHAAKSLKYLLNYYEFMSVGVSKRDLDEELLYETIGVTVTSMYDRAMPFIALSRSSQPLAFKHLERLVERWHEKIRIDKQQANLVVSSAVSGTAP